MAAAVINLYIEQGTNWTHILQFWQDSTKTIPTDFTECSGKCEIRDNNGVLIASSVVSFPGNGVIKLELSKTVTSAIVLQGIGYDQLAEFMYDLEVTDALGSTKRKANGRVEISPEVTR